MFGALSSQPFKWHTMRIFFKLVDVVPNDSQKRIAMTEEQQKIWMNFIREDKTYTKYYDEFVVLLGTGMRVSEFCGLTKSDLDFFCWIRTISQK